MLRRGLFSILVLFSLTAPPSAQAHCGDTLVGMLHLAVHWGVYAEARNFARTMHAGQIHGSHPFEYHLGRVDEVLHRFGYRLGSAGDARIRAVGQLHDICEDCEFTLEELERMFGRGVTDSVRLLTLPHGVPRNEAIGYQAANIGRNRMAVIARLADRIANEEDELFSLFEDGIDKWFHAYQAEWMVLRSALQPSTGDRRAHEMWLHLDRLNSNVEYAEQFYREFRGLRESAPIRDPAPFERVWFEDAACFPRPDLRTDMPVRFLAIAKARDAGIWP